MMTASSAHRPLGQKQLTMQAVFVVVLVLGVLVLAMSFALARLNATYDRLIGRPTHERRLTWLRSMRDEDWRAELHRQVAQLSAQLEQAVGKPA